VHIVVHLWSVLWLNGHIYVEADADPWSDQLSGMTSPPVRAPARAWNGPPAGNVAAPRQAVRRARDASKQLRMPALAGVIHIPSNAPLCGRWRAHDRIC
jgi:hypothetical protein